MRTHKEQENKNEGGLGIIEDEVPTEKAKAAYHHKAYQPPSEPVIEYIKKLRRKKHGDI